MAWEGVLKLCFCGLAVAGLRVPSREGHHVSAVDGLSALLPRSDQWVVQRTATTRRQAEVFAAINAPEPARLLQLQPSPSPATA